MFIPSQATPLARETILNHPLLCDLCKMCGVDADDRESALYYLDKSICALLFAIPSKANQSKMYPHEQEEL